MYRLLAFLFITSISLAADVQDILRPHMLLSDAEALLQKHGAKKTIIQILYPEEKTNATIETYELNNRKVIELCLIRATVDAPWQIKSLVEVIWPNQNEKHKEFNQVLEIALQ